MTRMIGGYGVVVFLPGFVSEFPDASVVADCVPASGLMLVNKITHNKYPASVAEREALQAAMPDPTPDAKPGTEDEGATNTQLAGGIMTRYGIPLAPSTGWPAIATILTKTNMGVVILGRYPELPAYIRNQGNQPSFTGLHDLYAQADGLGGVTVGDPLASRFIQGIPIADLRAYAESTGYPFLAGTEQVAKLVGYRLVIPHAGTWTFYRVMRWTHALYGAKPVYFSRASGAPVWHGAPGFWHIYAGALKDYYAVYGHTQAFSIVGVYSDGSLKPVPSNV